ncbi:hypothetical protein M3661_08480 [Paenibacillus sp. MER 180]|uniref:M56 family metallopeptidase n=1 Tax=Paenibacillus sp. MER 180 TaxID=2939570 RepID=UPI00203FB3E9|nr:M56 family metallopeptidase [Paenibacillus sp. MER 180]MCM3290162.1 hypothetical protein [Paenibacillus sp. MER 180]
MAHECARIQRRDVAVNWMMHILLIFHWFNPLLWLAVHKARQDQEMACDAYVLDRTSSQEHVQQNHAYGQTVGAFFRKTTLPGGCQPVLYS